MVIVVVELAMDLHAISLVLRPLRARMPFEACRKADRGVEHQWYGNVSHFLLVDGRDYPVNFLGRHDHYTRIIGGVIGSYLVIMYVHSSLEGDFDRCMTVSRENSGSEAE